VNKTRLPPAFGQEISAFPIFTDGKWFMGTGKDNGDLIKDINSIWKYLYRNSRVCVGLIKGIKD